MILNNKDRIYVAGHNGMVGSAIVRKLKSAGFNNLILRTRKELDLLDTTAVARFFDNEQPTYVILAAAKVGGIQANIDYPADFLLDNLIIQNNIIHQSYLYKVKKLVFLGSSCIYPKSCPQPIKEDYLLSGELEPTNEGYALAKITGLKLLAYYHKQHGFNSISLVPCNLYGTNDNFDPAHSHVLSALVKKILDAKENKLGEVKIWGTGIARREFMHVDDMANATLYFLENYHNPSFINIGWGRDISIKELVELIGQEVDFKGDILWETSKPNGMLKKCMDVSRMINAGFQPSISLCEGIKQTVREYKHLAKIV